MFFYQPTKPRKPSRRRNPPSGKEVFYYAPTGHTVGIYATRPKGGAAEVKLATDIAYEAAAQTGTVVSPAELKATSTSVRIRLAGKDASAIKEAAEIVAKLYEDHGYHVVSRPASERKFRAKKTGEGASKSRKSRAPRGVARFHTELEKRVKRGGRKPKALATSFADAISGWSMGGKPAAKPRKTAKKGRKELSTAQIHAKLERQMAKQAKRGGRKPKAFATPFADAIGSWGMKPAKAKKPRSAAQIASLKKAQAARKRKLGGFASVPANLQAEMARVANRGRGGAERFMY
jgi:hypothetical protein